MIHPLSLFVPQAVEVKYGSEHVGVGEAEEVEDEVVESGGTTHEQAELTAGGDPPQFERSVRIAAGSLLYVVVYALQKGALMH
jgi:hypothetical protein